MANITFTKYNTIHVEEKGEKHETLSNTYFMFPSQFSWMRCGEINGANIYSTKYTLLNCACICVFTYESISSWYTNLLKIGWTRKAFMLPDSFDGTVSIPIHIHSATLKKSCVILIQAFFMFVGWNSFSNRTDTHGNPYQNVVHCWNRNGHACQNSISIHMCTLMTCMHYRMSFLRWDFFNVKCHIEYTQLEVPDVKTHHQVSSFYYAYDKIWFCRQLGENFAYTHSHSNSHSLMTVI